MSIQEKQTEIVSTLQEDLTKDLERLIDQQSVLPDEIVVSEHLVHPTVGALAVITLVLGLIPILLYAYFYLLYEWFDSHGPLWDSFFGSLLVFSDWIALAFLLPLMTFVTGILGSIRTKRLHET